MALEKEIRTYERELPHLLEHTGKWALIHGDDVAGIYESWEEASAAGHRKFQLEPFATTQIGVVEMVPYLIPNLQVLTPLGSE